jgi:hypothetical protein
MNNRQRTPGDVPGAPQYGQGQMMERASEQIPRQPARPPRPSAEPTRRPTAVSLNAPTAFPDEPVTAGAAFGPGPGEATQITRAVEDNTALLKYLPALQAMAARPDASKTVRGFVMYLQGLTNDVIPR